MFFLAAEISQKAPVWEFSSHKIAFKACCVVLLAWCVCFVVFEWGKGEGLENSCELSRFAWVLYYIFNNI